MGRVMRNPIMLHQINGQQGLMDEIPRKNQKGEEIGENSSKYEQWLGNFHMH